MFSGALDSWSNFPLTVYRVYLKFCTCLDFLDGRPSIYDVHTEGGRGSGSGGRMWTGGREGVQPHVDVHTEN